MSMKKIGQDDVMANLNDENASLTPYSSTFAGIVKNLENVCYIILNDIPT